MKTPRDILFSRHQATAPKLDAVRRVVVQGLNNQGTKEPSQPAFLVSSLLGCWKNFQLELFWPCRRVWTGLAAVWIFLLAVNVSLSDNVSSVTGKPVRAGELIMSQQAQQRWMNELLADRTLPPEADRPRTTTPKPHSQMREMMSA